MRPDPARAEALALLMTTPIGGVERIPRSAGPAAARARDLVSGVRRHLFTIDAILGGVLEKGVGRVEPRLLEALRMGVFQIVYERQVARPLIVASTVNLAGHSGKKRGFVNAVLRKIASGIADEAGAPPRRARDCVIVRRDEFARFDGAVLPDPEVDLVAHLSAHYSQTPWFIEAMMREIGHEVDDFLLSSMLPLPLSLRVNSLRATPSEAEAALVAGGATVARSFGSVLEVRLPGPLSECVPFVDGMVTVQDVVASEVAPFLEPKPGERILDLCAGMGGKAIHVAELARGEAEVLATDPSAERLARLKENLARMRTPGVTVVGPDAAADLAGLGPFDRVLVDAPCSNSGVLMKRVGARYRLGPESVQALARTQLSLLERAAKLLRPGGTLVYATCSVLPHENGAVVTRFLERQAGAFVLADSRVLYPHRTGRDGGYMARLDRGGAQASGEASAC